MAIFFIPFFLTVIVAGTLWRGQWGAGSSAEQLLRDGAARWSNPVWQADTRATLASQGIDFVLDENGREIYRSAPDPLAGTQQRMVQELTIPDTNSQQVAYIYSSNWGSWRSPGGPYWLIPLVGFSTLLLTISIIAWLLGRMILRPLAATSTAARKVARGDLDFTIPESRVREVTEVSTAFQAMSDGLRESLRQQAELEE